MVMTETEVDTYADSVYCQCSECQAPDYDFIPHTPKQCNEQCQCDGCPCPFPTFKARAEFLDEDAWELAEETRELVDNMPKTTLFDYLPVRKGLFRLIPNFIYKWAYRRKYPED